MNDTLADLIQATQKVYTDAYRIGYEQGWRDAMKKAEDIIKGIPTTPASDRGEKR